MKVTQSTDSHNAATIDQGGSPSWLKIGGGIVALAVIIGIVAAFFMGGPKTTFLKRMDATLNATKLTQDYNLTLSGKGTGIAQGIDTLTLKGAATTSGDNSAFTAELTGLEAMGLELPTIKMASIDGKNYINVDLVTSYVETMYAMYGMQVKGDGTDYSQTYTELDTLLKALMGEESYKMYEKDVKSAEKNQKALAKDIQNALADYLKGLDKDKFTKGKDDTITLKMNKSDIKNLSIAVLTAVKDGKHYDGDKTAIEEAIKDIKNDFDNETKDYKLDIRLTYGKTLGDANVNLTIDGPDGKATATFTTKAKKYKAPTKPKKVVDEEELKSIMENLAPVFDTGEEPAAEETAENTTL